MKLRKYDPPKNILIRRTSKSPAYFAASSYQPFTIFLLLSSWISSIVWQSSLRIVFILFNHHPTVQNVLHYICHCSKCSVLLPFYFCWSCSFFHWVPFIVVSLPLLSSAQDTCTNTCPILKTHFRPGSFFCDPTNTYKSVLLGPFHCLTRFPW